jgi:CheY-like chemotaxis protein
MEFLPTILVVDDESDVRHLVAAVLTSSHLWNVVCAECGDDALEIAKRVNPALIILDRRMPNGDGLTTFLKLREDPRTRDTPVVLMSATLGNASSVPEGFAGIIPKPFDPSVLLERVSTILRDQSMPS